MFQLQHSERGGIALYLVMVVSLLLVTTTVLAARLSVSESRQASQVDQSVAAYYAAEAGVEEASRRLDINQDPNVPLRDIFPEQYDASGSRLGDRATLIDSSGNYVTGASFEIGLDSQPGASFGNLAWRQRQVYEEPKAPMGTLQKDETAELDTTDLRRECTSGVFGGHNGLDCDDTNIFTAFAGVEFCWASKAPNGVQPTLELTALSYPSNNASNITTRKVAITAGQPGANIGGGMSITPSSGEAPYTDCFELSGSGINQNTRHIFRIKPLFSGSDAQQNQSRYQIDYRTRLINANLNLSARLGGDRPLFIPNHTVLIDSIGQSGDVRRRIVARKERSGRILGLFDFTLYSGDAVLPLCRAGVQQGNEPLAPGVGYDLENCVVVGDDGHGLEDQPPEPPEQQPPTPTMPPPPPTTFTYSGGVQTYVVPSNVTRVTIEAWGAQGGDMFATAYGCASRLGGRGGYTRATYTVTPGETLRIYVGGAGDMYGFGGWNGGGMGRASGGSAGGGGASDVRRGGTGLNNRIIVAGGGGGAGSCMLATSGNSYVIYGQGYNGGAGGGLTGGSGPAHSSWQTAAGGGTQTAGGAPGTSSWWANGLVGALGNGGAGGGDTIYCCAGQGGGGGGGYFGGGGGAAGWNSSWNPSSRISGGGGGGGGSSFVGAGTSSTVTANNHSGHGRVIIAPQ